MPIASTNMLPSATAIAKTVSRSSAPISAIVTIRNRPAKVTTKVSVVELGSVMVGSRVQLSGANLCRAPAPDIGDTPPERCGFSAAWALGGGAGAARDAADGRRQRAEAVGLAHEGARTAGHRHVPPVLVLRVHDDGRLRLDQRQVGEEVEAVAAGHADVDDDDV